MSLTNRDDTPALSAGHEIAWTQWQRSKASDSSSSSSSSPLSSLSRLSSPIKATSSGARLTLSGPHYTFIFDTARGAPISWAVNNVALLIPDPTTGVAITPGFWRPATDNDVPASLPYWERFGVDALESQLRSFTIDTTSDPTRAIIKAHTYLTPPVLAWGFHAHITYTIHATGALAIDVTSLFPDGAMPTHVPRAGLNLRLAKPLDTVRWYGLGPGESYPDKKDAQRTGIFTAESVAELQTPYEVPQENANRMEARWVALTDAHGAGVKAAGAGAAGLFSWVASNNSIENVHAARHPPDLVAEDATLLRLDYKVAGVGTAACGPGVREDLLVKVEEMKFGFVLESVGL